MQGLCRAWVGNRQSSRGSGSARTDAGFAAVAAPRNDRKKKARSPHIVMRVLDPRIHVFLRRDAKTWMAGTKPGHDPAPLVSSSQRPSLRADGSRERAPDDRLREAIQSGREKILDCFVAFAPRNDGRSSCTGFGRNYPLPNPPPQGGRERKSLPATLTAPSPVGRHGSPAAHRD